MTRDVLLDVEVAGVILLLVAATSKAATVPRPIPEVVAIIGFLTLVLALAGRHR